MKYQHIRHATGIIQYAGVSILLDPMFAPKGVNPPIPNSWNELKNPLVDFPLELSSFKSPDYCLVTHLHPDHFDEYALNALPKSISLICQKEDADNFAKMELTNIIPIEDTLTMDGIKITRVSGQHGTGQIADLMGTSSGYILSSSTEPTLYITGDTIFYEDIKSTLNNYTPDTVIAFGGCAQFAEGDPITLSPEDILSIHQVVPQAKLICTHMDSINHCRTKKVDLNKFLNENLNKTIIDNSFFLPEDGEEITVKL